MNTRFDVGDKAYLEVTVLEVAINKDGVFYIVKFNESDKLFTTDKYLLKPGAGEIFEEMDEEPVWRPVKEATNLWKIQAATEAIMNGVDCADIANALGMTPEEVEDIKTQLEENV